MTNQLGSEYAMMTSRLTFVAPVTSHLSTLTLYKVLVAIPELGVTALMVLLGVKGPEAARGEQEGLEELPSVTLKVPFISVFLMPGLSWRDSNRDDEGS